MTWAKGTLLKTDGIGKVTKNEIESTLREVLCDWPLYRANDHVQVRRFNGVDGLCWSIQYCGFFEGVPFSASMRIADEPPNFLILNMVEDRMYLLTIQIEQKYRGQGFGEQLYDLVVDFARELGCAEVWQTPSGGYGDDDRGSYLARRGWQWDEKQTEMFKVIG